MDSPSLDVLENQLSAAAETLDLDGDLTFKPMFGGVCAYHGGRVFASLSNIGLALKLPPQAQNELLALPAAKRLRYEPDAPESKSYVVVPPTMQETPDTLAVWVRQSVDFVQSQPAPRARKRG